jgi:hypothetical protein
MSSFETKHDRKIRELVLYFAAVILFPLKTIRALIWQWHFWLEKVDAKIKNDHDEYYRL